MEPVERIGWLGQFILDQARSLQIVSRHEPDDSIGGAQCENDGYAAPKHIAAKIQARDLSNHHVLRISDQRCRRAEVAGNCQRNQKWNGIDLLAQKCGAGDRRKNEANDVVIKKSGKAAAGQHQNQKKSRGMSELIARLSATLS